MIIRWEETKDIQAIRQVNETAFTSPAEANLVDVLRKECKPILSLVAEEGGQVVGHILFSPVRLTGYEALKLMGLGPMAVRPGWQRKGIGPALVRAGLEKCSEAGYGAAVVLGHTWFYPQFGFKPSVSYGIRCEYPAPEEAFMVVELQPGYLAGASGTIKYHPAFDNI